MCTWRTLQVWHGMADSFEGLYTLTTSCEVSLRCPQVKQKQFWVITGQVAQRYLQAAHWACSGRTLIVLEDAFFTLEGHCVPSLSAGKMLLRSPPNKLGWCHVDIWPQGNVFLAGIKRLQAWGQALRTSLSASYCCPLEAWAAVLLARKNGALSRVLLLQSPQMHEQTSESMKQCFSPWCKAATSLNWSYRADDRKEAAGRLFPWRIFYFLVHLASEII